MKQSIGRFAWLGGAMCWASAVGAQTYSIDWHQLTAGGNSAAGSYSLRGSVGSHVADGPGTGGAYSLVDGLGAVYTGSSFTSLVGIQLTNTSVIVSWPSYSPGFHLEYKTSLPGDTWRVPMETVQDNGTQRYILVQPTQRAGFYRLQKP